MLQEVTQLQICRLPSHRISVIRRQIWTKIVICLHSLEQGFLNFFVPWTPVTAWWNLQTPSQKKYIYMNKRDRFLEVNKRFWSLKFINYFAVYIKY